MLLQRRQSFVMRIERGIESRLYPLDDLGMLLLRGSSLLLADFVERLRPNVGLTLHQLFDGLEQDLGLLSCRRQIITAAARAGSFEAVSQLALGHAVHGLQQVL